MLAMLVIVPVLLLRHVGSDASKAKRRARNEKRLDQKETKIWGSLNSKLFCPHCQTSGLVRTMPVKRKKGISGAKATGALLTGGFSILATGLSRKELATQSHCGNCNSTWDV